MPILVRAVVCQPEPSGMPISAVSDWCVDSIPYEI
jgi:hypothetical protein